MAPRITCQTVLVPATASGTVEEGLLIFGDDTLLAVVMRLDSSVDDSLRGRWFLEVGFGPCAVHPASDLLFHSADEAKAWVREQVARARGAAGSQFA